MAARFARYTELDVFRYSSFASRHRRAEQGELLKNRAGEEPLHARDSECPNTKKEIRDICGQTEFQSPPLGVRPAGQEQLHTHVFSDPDATAEDDSEWAIASRGRSAQ